MGAIFGFSGWSGKATKQMAAVLGHRGRAPAHVQSSIQSTAAYLSSRSAHGGIVEEKGLVLAVAGQLFSDREISLLSLLRRYRQQGMSFVRDLRGSFVLSVLDRGNIHLARCGSGARTIFYGMHKECFIFAIEAKGVLAYPGFPKNLRPAAVGQYLTFGFIPGPTTMFADMRELPAGHTVSFKNGKMYNPRCFFFFEQQVKEEQDEEEWLEEFRVLLGQAVKERLPASASAGLLLSGGLASCVVGTELVAEAARSVPSWSFHCNQTSGVEQELALAAAAHLGTEHQLVSIQAGEILQQLNTLTGQLDEPVADPMILADSMLSARAAQDVDVLFSGHGGNTVFGGSAHLPMLLQHWYGGIERGSLFREQAYLTACQLAYRDLDDLLSPEWRSRYNPKKVLEGMVSPFFKTKQPAGFLDKLSALAIRLNGAHLILPRVERLSCAHGLTQVCPLFDEQLIELSFRMPSTLKLRRGIDRVLMKQAYRKKLPARLPDRSRSGKQVPVNFWFSKELRVYAQEVLSPDQLRQTGIFNPDTVKTLLDRGMEPGRPGQSLTLWMLISFELWRRRVFEGEELE
jgi:asparagine synthase (glutamine-hydrolysing)